MKRGCFSGFIRIAIRTRSNTARPRSTMSRCPFVMGSTEPGKTASEPSGRFFFTLPPSGPPPARPVALSCVRSPDLPSARPAAPRASSSAPIVRPASLTLPVEAQASGRRPASLGAGEGPVVPEGPACGSAPPPPPRPPRGAALRRAAQQRFVEVAVVGRVEVHDVKLHPLVAEGPYRRSRVLPEDPHLAPGASPLARSPSPPRPPPRTCPRERPSPRRARAPRARPRRCRRTHRGSGNRGSPAPGCRRATAGPARRWGGSRRPRPSSGAGPSPPPR